ncbi:MAG: insulinase family protein [Candidatus Omnitrophica bacterium]|nr:insulinase family protein [Candidatus Omnitrophota bacterium]
MHRYNTHTLNNGLRVIAHNMPNMKSVALGIWIATGGRHEDIEKRGISHFIEHLLFKGTSTRSAAKIKNSIEGIGGSLNAFTSEELTCYLVKVPAKYQNLGVEILSDMVLNARFDSRDIFKERMVILEEIKMYKDQPDQYVQDLLAELLWPDHTLGIPLIGTYEIINALSRSDLLNYKDKEYVPSNITVVACGDIDWRLLISSCSKLFSKRRVGKSCPYEAIKITQDAPKSKIFTKDTEQTHVALGFHGISRRNPSRYAMDILNVILGANMSSRLFHELREKRGLAYAISSHASYFNDGGYMVIDAGVDNGKIVDFISLALKELVKIKKKVVAKNEFERAKEYYRGHLSFILEDTLSHMLWLGRKVVTDDEPLDIAKILEKIDRVSQDDLSELSKKVFKSDNLNIGIVGPIDEAKKEKIEESIRNL